MTGTGTGRLTRAWLLRLAGLAALVAVAVAATLATRASYTTGSTVAVRAQADSASSWLHLYSQPTDPDGLGGYALRRVQFPPGPPAAAGADEALTVDLGGFPDRNQTFTFNRVFTVKTPATFPDPAVTAVTITVTRLADPATGEQPLGSATIAAVGSTGGATTVTLGPGQKRQVNMTVRQRRRFELGRTYYPVVRLELSFTGGSLPAGYYRYDVPVAVTDAGW